MSDISLQLVDVVMSDKPVGRGRPRTEKNQQLPPGMLARVRPTGTNYYLSRRVSTRKGARREEIALGQNLDNALAEYSSLMGEATPQGRSLVHRPWLATDLYAACKRSAKRRGMECTLSLRDIEELVLSSKGKCMLTGIKFNVIKPATARRRHWIPSVDRIDSKKGYVPGNVRLICSIVNIALNDFGEELLLQIARELLRHRRKNPSV